MMYSGLRGTVYQLESSILASGGEGEVYRIHNETGSVIAPGNKVAKIYHAAKLSMELIHKIAYMIGHPPSEEVLGQIAWPLDALLDENRKFRGFVMMELELDTALSDIYQYPPVLGLSVKQKIIIAENICAVIAAVHNAGYVFGDFNPQNIGIVLASGRVAFLDTDSYHVFDQSQNRHYRCKVCADGYAAPELLEACGKYAVNHPHDNKQLYEKAPLPTFTRETDYFALAIHIFKLLMNGFTPFGGIIESTTPSLASPGIGNAAIRRNEYSFRPGFKPLSAAVPPLDILPQEVADLFTRAFLVAGSVNPLLRPTPVEWHQALSRYELGLINCSANQLHQYDPRNEFCPFCVADRRFQDAINGKVVQEFIHPTIPLSSLLQQKTFSTAPVKKNVPLWHVSESVRNVGGKGFLEKFPHFKKQGQKAQFKWLICVLGCVILLAIGGWKLSRLRGLAAGDITELAGSLDITKDFKDPAFRRWVYENKSEPSLFSESEPIMKSDVENITEASIDNADIKSLSGIEHFTNLRYLELGNTSSGALSAVQEIPELPGNLQEFYYFGNKLFSLPELPSSLQVLSCSSLGQGLTSLPELPSGLQKLYCWGTPLIGLPELPSSLQVLQCRGTQLTDLPELPSGLWFLNCEDNQLTSLPELPSSLQVLACQGNQLTSLPELPSGLEDLSCHSNQLTSLPELPIGLKFLDCRYNQLIVLPELPDGLTLLDSQKFSIKK